MWSSSHGLCRGDPAAEYSRKLEYLKREEELIKEEELEAEAILQPSGQTLQVPHLADLPITKLILLFDLPRSS